MLSFLGASKFRSHGGKLYNPDAALWKPGYGCPVPSCNAKKLRDYTQLSRHWAAKHEKIVAKFTCSKCFLTVKRKDYLYHHFRLKHGADTSEACDKTEYQNNLEYHNPAPLTLDIVLGLMSLD